MTSCSDGIFATEETPQEEPFLGCGEEAYAGLVLLSSA